MMGNNRHLVKGGRCGLRWASMCWLLNKYKRKEIVEKKNVKDHTFLSLIKYLLK